MCIASLSLFKLLKVYDIDWLFGCKQLMIEGGTAVAVFVRCFVDKKGIETELRRRLHVEFPRWVLATISV